LIEEVFVYVHIKKLESLIAFLVSPAKTQFWINLTTNIVLDFGY
jgi:hypothetical protein